MKQKLRMWEPNQIVIVADFHPDDEDYEDENGTSGEGMWVARLYPFDSMTQGEDIDDLFVMIKDLIELELRCARADFIEQKERSIEYCEKNLKFAKDEERLEEKNVAGKPMFLKDD